jgi:pyruvate dehydrogenase E1 component alpha subunit
LNRDLAKQLLYDMILARRFEEAAAEQYAQGNIAGFLHLYPGEEAVAVGTLHAADLGDYIVTTYREHVHALMRGISPNAVMAELFGRSGGCSGGYGGSMHLFDIARRFLGGYAIVGETFPVALGVAYQLKLSNAPDVVVCFFGEGAVNQGTFHESLNMAALWQLPILFICENNHYQIGTEVHRNSAIAEVYKRACAYGIESRRVDGMDVLATYSAAGDAMRHIREGNGPFLLECDTYRYRGHSMADNAAYRSDTEVAELKARDPLITFRRQAIEEGWVDESLIRQLEQQADKTIDEAVRFAEASPAPEDLYENLYTNPLDLYGGRP